MSIATATPRKVPTKRRVPAAKCVAGGAVGSQALVGQALLDDMEVYRKKVAASPKSARNFLTRLGVMTRSGRVKTLIRG